MEKSRKRKNVILWVLFIFGALAMIFVAILGRMTLDKKEYNLRCVIESLEFNETYVVSDKDYQYLIGRLDYIDSRGLKPGILFAGISFNVLAKDSLYILSNIFKPVEDQYTLHVIKRKFIDSTTLLFITKKEGLLKQ